MNSVVLTKWARFTRIAVTIVTLAACGCSLEDASGPPLTGPSRFALSVTMTATPDRLPRDGSSQSVITLIVRDEGNRLVPGQRLTLTSNARLSATEIVTDASGQANFTVTAPPASALVGDVVTVEAIPVGSSGASAIPRVVTVSLTGAANTTVPTAPPAPTPPFTVIPTPPEVGQVVTFNASGWTDEGVPCLDACGYSWNFGDGSTAAGRIVNHAFSAAGTYTVTLTVTDSAGASASAFLAIRVVTVPAPTVTALNVAPDPPFVDRQAVFTAVASAAPGHSIQRYEWNFGDETTQVTTTPTVVKTYDEVGTFVVTVKVIDDLNQATHFARSVVVGHSAAAPVANFTVSPSSPAVGVTVTFNGTSSTVGVGATIAKYVWDFGAGGAPQDTGTTASTTAVYGSAGTFVVTLTITDSLGRQASKTATLTVVP